MATATAFSIALVIAAFFTAICIWLPIIWTKRFHIYGGDKKAKAEIEDSYRRTLAQLLGAAAIAMTFAWTWIKDHETIEQTRTQATNQGFGEAAKLISTENVDTRAAGVYLMENLVRSSPEYYRPVLHTLQSLIKSHQPKQIEEGAERPKVSEDVKAAIYVLGRLPHPGITIDMRDLYLAGADFKDLKEFRGADFQGAQLFATNFSGADLTGAIFDGAQMTDWISFGSARWTDERWEWWKGPLAWERVRYAALFDWANLTGVSFGGALLAGASFQNAILDKVNFSGADLSRVDFQNSKNPQSAIFDGACYYPSAAPLGLSESLLVKLKIPC
jgi:hypothetical protein